MTGRIKHLAPTYGFIRPDRYVASNRGAVFFHQSAVTGGLEFENFTAGDRVDFELEEPASPTNPKAREVLWVGGPQ